MNETQRIKNSLVLFLLSCVTEILEGICVKYGDLLFFVNLYLGLIR